MIYYCFDENAERNAKREHLNAHALLALALNERGIADYIIKKMKGGKPYIENCPYFFSLTHTDGFCAVAISEEEVGIDAEHLDRSINEKMLERICSENELAGISANEDAIRLWTLKEAAAKLTGRGIAQMLEGIAFDMNTLYSHDVKCYGEVYEIGNIIIAACEKTPPRHELKRIEYADLQRFL